MSEFEIDCFEVSSLAAFNGKSRDDFCRDFRSTNKANLIIVRIPNFGLSVGVLAAPVNYSLCALEKIPPLFCEMMNSSSSRSRDEEEYLRLAKMLESQGVTNNLINPALLVWISGEFKTSSGYASLFRKSAESFGDYRVSSFLVSSEDTNALSRYIKVANSQFSEFSFCGAEEGCEFMGGPSPSSYNFREFDPLCVFLSPRKPDFGVNVRGREAEEGMSRRALLDAIEALESGARFPWKMHYKNFVRPPVTLPFLPSKSAKIDFGKWAEVDFELLSLRCRLIRLLGWPQMFSAFSVVYDEEAIRWKVVSKYGSESQRSMLADAVKGLDLPYDPLVEIDAYLLNVVERYPILFEKPF